MNLKIDFSDPIIQKDDVLEITTKTLDSFYTSSKELDQLRQHRINAKNRIIQWVPNKNCE